VKVPTPEELQQRYDAGRDDLPLTAKGHQDLRAMFTGDAKTRRRAWWTLDVLEYIPPSEGEQTVYASVFSEMLGVSSTTGRKWVRWVRAWGPERLIRSLLDSHRGWFLASGDDAVRTFQGRRSRVAVALLTVWKATVEPWLEQMERRGHGVLVLTIRNRMTDLVRDIDVLARV
jgi:hypothetical protein